MFKKNKNKLFKISKIWRKNEKYFIKNKKMIYILKLKKYIF